MDSSPRPPSSTLTGSARASASDKTAARAVATINTRPESFSLVNAASTEEPDRGVMLYSTPDKAVTVVWLFDAEP